MFANECQYDQNTVEMLDDVEVKSIVDDGQWISFHQQCLCKYKVSTGMRRDYWVVCQVGARCRLVIIV